MSKQSYQFEHIEFNGYVLSVHGTYHKEILNHREHDFSVDKIEMVDNEDNSPLPSDINIGDLEAFIIKTKFE